MIKRDLLTVAALLIAAPALAQALDPHPGHQMSGAATQAPPARPSRSSKVIASASM
jgi:hypothetical protein